MWFSVEGGVMSVQLRTNGKVFSNWQSIDVDRSINSISGRFTISYVDRSKNGESNWDIKCGDDCELVLDGETVISGFIDILQVDLSSENRVLTITGRDKSGDLVDSGTLLDEKAFIGSNLKDMATQVIGTFRVPVSAQGEAANRQIESASVQYNETIYEFISRVAHYQGVLCYSNRKGEIVFSDVATTVSDSISFKNKIIRITGKSDSSKLFQQYIAVTHTTSVYEGHKNVIAISPDENIKKPRFKTFIIPSGTTYENAKARADWEKAIHIARSFKANVTLLGWTNSQNEIWDVNQLVYLDADESGIKSGSYLIESIKYSLSERGKQTDLTLVLPDSYKVNPDKNDYEEGVQE